MNFKFLYLILLIQILLFTKCINNAEKDENADYLVFGDFYGECVGEGCIDIYKIQNENLYADTLDIYPSYLAMPHKTSYIQLTTQQYILVKDLWYYFPDSLYIETEILIGQPDAADGGGFYLETNKNGKQQYWLIDKIKSNVPAYLHSFMDSLDIKLTILN